jgi:hypothetical protein
MADNLWALPYPSARGTDNTAWTTWILSSSLLFLSGSSCSAKEEKQYYKKRSRKQEVDTHTNYSIHLPSMSTLYQQTIISNMLLQPINSLTPSASRNQTNSPTATQISDSFKQSKLKMQ